jgi:hypothetical protein
MGYVGVRRVYHAVICRLSAARISRPFEAGAAAAERSGEGADARCSGFDGGVQHEYKRSLSPDPSGWEKASLKAKSHPGAWPDGFCGELPAGIPVPFTLWIVT